MRPERHSKPRYAGTRCFENRLEFFAGFLRYEGALVMGLGPSCEISLFAYTEGLTTRLTIRLTYRSPKLHMKSVLFIVVRRANRPYGAPHIRMNGTEVVKLSLEQEFHLI